MNKKLFTIFVFIAAVCIIGISSVVAKSLFINPEIQALSQKNIQDKIKDGNALKEEEARIIEKQNTNMSEDKKDTVIQEKEQEHKKRMKEIASYIPPSVQQEKNSFKGIIEGNDVPAPFRSNEFVVLNFWGGEINGKMIGVYAGYRPENPSQGVVVVFNDKDSSKYKFYSAPKSTSPVRIISEANGILTLESVAGEFEIYNQDAYPPTKVRVKGIVAYSFDTGKQLFTSRN